MTERPEIELSRERGDWIEHPRGPLDKPKTLWFVMALSGGLALLSIVLCFISGKPGYSVLVAIFTFLTGGAFAGRFPALFFRGNRR